LQAYTENAMSAPAERQWDRPHQTNVVVTVTLDVHDIDLKALARQQPGLIYHRFTFAAASFRLKNPHSTCLVYPIGVLVCMGSKSITEARLACQKYVRLLCSFGVQCRIIGFKVDNVVSSVLTPFPLDLPKLKCDWDHMVTFDRAEFPGATLKCSELPISPPTSITMELFASGKINITGADSVKETDRVYDNVRDNILVRIRVDPNAQIEFPAQRRLAIDYDARYAPVVVENTRRKRQAARPAAPVASTKRVRFSEDVLDKEDEKEYIANATSIQPRPLPIDAMFLDDNDLRRITGQLTMDQAFFDEAPDETIQRAMNLFSAIAKREEDPTPQPRPQPTSAPPQGDKTGILRHVYNLNTKADF
jgi:TATA-box binding protein (TBP) (component of TFIID and TFIIIB)